MSWRDDLFPRSRLRERQRSFIAGRRQVNQSDDAFAAEAYPEADATSKECVFMLRRMIARRCNCSPTLLLASDSTSELHRIMGEASFWGSFFTLGDLGPEEVFFQELENEYQWITGQVSYFDPATRDGLTDDWRQGQSFGSWVSKVIQQMQKWQRPSEQEARAALRSRSIRMGH